MQCRKQLTGIGRHLCTPRSVSHLALLAHQKSFSCIASTSRNVRARTSTIDRIWHLKYVRLWRPNSTKAVYVDPTIFALSTAPGRAAIAVVRCSGPACIEIYKGLCPNKPLPKPRAATLRKLYTPQTQSPDTASNATPDAQSSTTDLLDPGALILYFPAPNTVTGEPVLELHLHGGPATVRAVLSAISHLTTPSRPIRPAEPGEFTRRAFYNTRLSLPQIESLSDTLAAETEQQRQLAARGSSGILGARYESWRHQLLAARGELEALIDFSEDQHFDESPAQLARSVAGKVKMLVGQVEASRGNAARGELLRSGIKVALLGAPNVGKSSLLNRVVGREAAIVSAEAGTTRDVVETNVDIGGFFCNLGDLAGVRDRVESSGGGIERGTGGEIGVVEQEGIRRAKARALEADVVVVVRACERDESGKLSVPLPNEVAETLEKCDLKRQAVVQVINKIDLAGATPAEQHQNISSILENECSLISLEDTVYISCAPSPSSNPSDPSSPPSNLQDTTHGIPSLLTLLTSTFTSLTTELPIPGIPRSSSSDVSLGASERQARLLETCQQELLTFLEAVDLPDETLAEKEEEAEVDIVVAAESLRAAAEALARITGRGEAGDVEEVLGVVFENFCVGK